MLENRGRKKEGMRIELACSLCGKPLAGKGNAWGTRSSTKEEHCLCRRPKLVLDDSAKQDGTTPPQNIEENALETEQSETLKSLSAWQSAVLANLPEQYEVLTMIGEGGMGTVWKVHDTTLDKDFAIKVLRSWLIENNEALLRFEQEAESAHNLNHANIANVHSFGMGKHGAPYLVMDFLEGENLAKIIQAERCIGAPRAINLFMQIGEAIGHAHGKGVLHRDIKPTNIIVARNEDGTEVAKLLDFGIAKVLPKETGVAKGQTRAGEVFGTPPYMSPEQCLGDNLDDRSDVYSFGCVMYEALSGSPLFSGESPMKTMLKHIDEKPLELRKASKEQVISKDLEYVVMRCLEKLPLNRYQSMQELVEDLRQIKENKPIEKPVTSAEAAAALNSPGSSAITDPGLPSESQPNLSASIRHDSSNPPSGVTSGLTALELSQLSALGSSASSEPETTQTVSSRLRALERDSHGSDGDLYRTTEADLKEEIDPDLFRLYRDQTQSLKMVCALLTILLVCLAALYLTTSLHPQLPGVPTGSVSDRHPQDSVQTNDDLVNVIEKGAQAFVATQQYENAIPLLEAAAKSQQHSGKFNNIALARDQEGLGRCYVMLGNADRAGHWYELALRTYEDVLAKDGSGFNRNSDWALGSTCAKDYADVLTKLNRISEAQALERKWARP